MSQYAGNHEAQDHHHRMNGQLFDPRHTRKNIALNRFEIT